MPLTMNLRVLPVATLLILLSASAWAQEETMFDETFDADVADLSVRVHDADVSIGTADSETVRVRIIMSFRDRDRAESDFEAQGFDAALENGTLRISSDPDRDLSRRITDWRNRPSYHVRVEMPVDIAVTIRTSDGDIAVDRLAAGARLHTADGDIALGAVEGGEIAIRTADGDIAGSTLIAETISLKTSDGDIALGNVEGKAILAHSADGDIALKSVRGALTLETSDGDVSIGSLVGPNSSIRSSDGDIAIADVEGSIDVAASDGDVVLSLAKPGEVLITTSDGDVTVSLPRTLSAALEARGEHVQIQRLPGFDGTVKSDRADGTLGNGGPLIRIRASDGNITVRGQ